MAAKMHPPQSQFSPAHQQSRSYHAQQLTPSTSNDGPTFNALQDDARQGNPPPSLPLQVRQARPSVTSRYRPAVLRPTERPSRHFPLTPPQSSSNSFDSMQGAESPMYLTRQSTAEGITNSALDGTDSRWFGAHALGKVTGAPTKDHWKPDSCVSNCDAATCNKLFGLFERKHHCRRCGNIFCGAHTPFSVRLDQHARFHPDGTYSRACDMCWSEYRTWQADRCSRANSIVSQEATEPITTSITNMGAGCGNSIPGSTLAGVGLGVQKVGSVAASVPRDWVWSTF
ncbi:MAG: hypothetical protein M1816_002785 [Peltula sp. TS41687]|nr:MAG: hypothetical protein M1816_002785 [Peltula sp. TS41687]